MTSGEDDKRAPAPAKPAGAEREARLAQALRANLRRRKAAARPDEKAPPKGG